MIGLLFAALLIVLNGLFVAAEFAFVKMHATQLHSRVRRGERRAIAAQHVIERLDSFLSVTQIGVTFASLGLGWVGEPAFEALVMRLTRGYLHPETQPVTHAVIVVIAFGMLTLLHVLAGELVPKLIAIQRSEQIALITANPLRGLFFALRPLLFVLEQGSRLILRAMGMSPDSASEGTLSEEEILGILVASAARSPKGQQKAALLERVARFAERTARNAMVPRVDVASLPIRTTPKDAVVFLKKEQFSRVLLTKERLLDEVEGYLYTKDLFLLDEAERAADLASLRRDVLFVPESQSLVDVLRGMQESQTPIAVVVDEYGGTSGIVTMEDLLEEIVGKIRDEFDREPARFEKIQGEEGTWDVDARAPLEELRQLGVAVEEDEADPVGTVVVSKLGRVPRKGDHVEIAPNAVATVTSVSRRRIIRVRVHLKKEQPAP